MDRQWNDFELLYYVRQKDEIALDLLLHKYEGFVYSIIQRSMVKNSLCKGHLDDLALEAKSAMMDALNDFQEYRKCTFSTFYFLCAKRKVQTTIKHYYTDSYYLNIAALNNNCYCNEDGQEYYLDFKDEKDLTFDPEFYYKYDELIDLLTQVVNNLSSKEKKALALHLSNHSYKKAAEILHISIKKYDNIIQKIKRVIKAEIADNN